MLAVPKPVLFKLCILFSPGAKLSSCLSLQADFQKGPLVREAITKKTERWSLCAGRSVQTWHSDTVAAEACRLNFIFLDALLTSPSLHFLRKAIPSPFSAIWWESLFAFQTVSCLHFFLHPLLNPQQSSCFEQKPKGLPWDSLPTYRLSCPSENLSFFFSQHHLVGGLELLKSIVLSLLISKLRLVGNLPQVSSKKAFRISEKEQ